MKKYLLTGKIVLFAVAAVAFVSCDDDDNNNDQPSITEIAVSNPDFSTLVTALQITGLAQTLDEDGTYTVFAPTNAAFNTFLSANGYPNINAVPVPALREVLLNHVLATEEFSGDLGTGYVKTLAKGGASTTNTLSMYIDLTSGVKLNGGASNGGATVVTADIDADNGVIHVVDAVIGLPTVVNHAIANPNFTSLVAALTRPDQPDFVGTLSDTGSTFTVFAPTNQAFADLLTELSLPNLTAVPQTTLTSALQYHVVSGANVLSTSLTNNQTVTTLQGGTFTVQLPNSGPQIVDANGRIAEIIKADVQASNGVIHVLNKVILP